MDGGASLWYTVKQPNGAMRREGPALDSAEVFPSIPQGTLLGCRNRRRVGDTERVEVIMRCYQKPLGLVASEFNGWVSTKVLSYAAPPTNLLDANMRPVDASLFDPQRVLPDARAAATAHQEKAIAGRSVSVAARAAAEVRRPAAAAIPKRVDSSSDEDEIDRKHCHAWIVEKKFAAVRSDVSTDSEHLADVRSGRIVVTSSRRVVAETGNVRLRMIKPLEGWVSEKVLRPFKWAKRWRIGEHCQDCRFVIDVRSAGKKGMAVYVRHPIPKNTFVGEYRGDLIDEAEYDRRYPKGDGTHVYWIREADMYMDAGPSRHFTRFINHSKRAPNLETKVEFVRVVGVGSAKEEVLVQGRPPKIGFWTTKDIPAGDELTFDYGGDYFGDEEPAPTEDTVYPPMYRDAIQSGRMTEKDVIIDRTLTVFERTEASKAAEAAAWADQKARENGRDSSLNDRFAAAERARIAKAFAPEVDHFPISKSQSARENRLGLVPYDRRPQPQYYRWPKPPTAGPVSPFHTRTDRRDEQLARVS